MGLAAWAIMFHFAYLPLLQDKVFSHSICLCLHDLKPQPTLRGYFKLNMEYGIKGEYDECFLGEVLLQTSAHCFPDWIINYLVA